MCITHIYTRVHMSIHAYPHIHIHIERDICCTLELTLPAGRHENRRADPTLAHVCPFTALKKKGPCLLPGQDSIAGPGAVRVGDLDLSEV